MWVCERVAPQQHHWQLMSSAFEKGQDSIVARRKLTQIDYHQPPAPMELINAQFDSFVKGALKWKRMESLDMTHYWLQDKKQ